MSVNNRILIVEDDQVTRTLLKVTMERCGTCIECATGSDALKMITESLTENKPFHLICLDLNINDVDGRAVLRALRSMEEVYKTPRCSVLVITGNHDKESVLGSFNDGCEAYLTKPIELKLLKEQLLKIGLLS